MSGPPPCRLVIGAIGVVVNGTRGFASAIVEAYGASTAGLAMAGFCIVSSLEETGLALEALAAAWPRNSNDAAMRAALARGGAWLAAAVENEQWQTPVPIGFYFAKLWYFERLYPLIFATGALTRMVRL